LLDKKKMEAELFKTAQPVQKIPFGTGKLGLSVWSVSELIFQIPRRYGTLEYLHHWT
jgi:hypothetical protein